MLQRSSAQLYAWFAGGLFLILAVIGMTVEGSFGIGDQAQSDTLAGFSFNGWYIVLYALLAGTLLLASARLAWVRGIVLGVGIVLLVIAAYGFVQDETVTEGLLPLHTNDSLLHLALGVSAVLAGLAPVSVEERVGPDTRLVP